MICNRNWLGGWLLPQKHSYFVSVLPHNWWVFAFDFSLTNDINTTQFKYFAKIVKRYFNDKTRNERVIIITHLPDWIINAHEKSNYGSNLSYLLSNIIGKDRIRLRLAGDIHNYTRHEVSILEVNRNKLSKSDYKRIKDDYFLYEMNKQRKLKEKHLTTKHHTQKNSNSKSKATPHSTTNSNTNSGAIIGSSADESDSDGSNSDDSDNSTTDEENDSESDEQQCHSARIPRFHSENNVTINNDFHLYGAYSNDIAEEGYDRDGSFSNDMNDIDIDDIDQELAKQHNLSDDSEDAQSSPSTRLRMNVIGKFQKSFQSMQQGFRRMRRAYHSRGKHKNNKNNRNNNNKSKRRKHKNKQNKYSNKRNINSNGKSRRNSKSGKKNSSHKMNNKTRSRYSSDVKRKSTSWINRGATLVVSGGGGAFMHPTHVPSRQRLSYLDLAYERVKEFPKLHTSYRYSIQNIFGFRKRNLSFDLMGAILYYALVFSLFPLCNLNLQSVDYSNNNNINNDNNRNELTLMDMFYKFCRIFWIATFEIFENSYVSITFGFVSFWVVFALVDGYVGTKWRFVITTFHWVSHYIAAVSIVVIMEMIIEAALENKLIGVDSTFDTFITHFPKTYQLLEMIDPTNNGYLIGFFRSLFNFIDITGFHVSLRKQMCETKVKQIQFLFQNLDYPLTLGM